MIRENQVLEIKKSFLKKMIRENQVLEIKKSFLKKMIQENQVLKVKKNLLVIQIILNILINKLRTHRRKVIRKILLLKIKRSLKIENGQKILPSISTKAKDSLFN